MKFPIYQIDAFAEELFSGNPAAVIILNDWLDDSLMNKIAAENNLSETAFIVRMPDFYEIRWFTPTTEVDLCGHATLAAGFVVMNFIEPNRDKVSFISENSGILEVEKKGALYELDFPQDKISEYKVSASDDLIKGIGIEPKESYIGRYDILLVYENENIIKKIEPDCMLLKKVKTRGIIVTAPGDDVDFVSRFFAPQAGIIEDPVTGSSHTLLVPYWHKQTGKIELIAKQLSQRQGILQCVITGKIIKIAGKAKLYLKGDIFVK